MNQATIRACAGACALVAAWVMLGPAHAAGPSGGAGQAQETGRSQALAALEAQVRAAADQIRMDLDAAESGTDYRPLLERKLTVDTSLLAAWLLEDAQLLVRAVDAGIPPPPMLRGLCAEHSPDAWTQSWSHDPRVVADALRPWAGQPSVAALARSMAHCGAEGDAPPLIQWLVHSQLQPAPQVSASALWCEPCLAAQWIDWPLDPTGLTVEWSNDRCLVRTAEGQDAAESWANGIAPFCNPPELYCVADALRAHERGTPALVAVEPWEGAPRSNAQADDAHIVVRTVHRQDGSLLRTERWVLNHGALRWLLLEQGPLRVVHSATHAVDIVEEVPGQAPRTALHQAQATLVHPPGGMRVVIAFSARPFLGSNGAGLECSVPELIRVYASGIQRAEVTFSSVFAGSAADVAAVCDQWDQATSQGAALRQRTRRAVFAAAAAGDAPLVAELVRRAADDAAQDSVPAPWVAANASAAAALLGHAGFTEGSALVARQVWLPALTALSDAERSQAVEWALQHRVPLLSEMLQAPLAVQDVMPAAPPAGTATVQSVVCDDPSPGTPAAAALDAIRAVLQSVPALTPPERETLSRAACAGLHASTDAASAPQGHSNGVGVSAWPEGAVVGADLKAALRAEGQSLLRTPALFAQRVQVAAAAGWPQADARRASQQQVLGLADAFAQACHMLADQGVLQPQDAPSLARLCRARAALLAERVGNPFLPAWRAVVDRSADLPSVQALAAGLASDPLVAGQLRSLPTLAQLQARIRPDVQPTALEQRQADALVQAWMRAVLQVLQAERQSEVGKPVGRSAEAPIVRLKEAPP